MQIRPTAFTIGLIIYSFIALFFVYTEFGIDSPHNGHLANISLRRCVEEAKKPMFSAKHRLFSLVEHRGFEPLTPTLPV